MQYIQKESREQITFLPDCIEDYISDMKRRLCGRTGFCHKSEWR